VARAGAPGTVAAERHSITASRLPMPTHLQQKMRREPPDRRGCGLWRRLMAGMCLADGVQQEPHRAAQTPSIRPLRKRPAALPVLPPVRSASRRRGPEGGWRVNVRAGSSVTPALRAVRGERGRVRAVARMKLAPAPAKAVTIRAHLLLLVLIVLLPAAVAAIWIIDRTYRAERELMERNLRDTTRALSMVVDAELSKRAAVAAVLAESHLLDAGAQMDADDLQRFVQKARKAVGNGGGWVELLDGERVLLDTRLSPGRPPPVARRPAAGAAVPTRDPDHAVLSPLQQSMEGRGMVAAVTQPVRRNGQNQLELKLTIVPQELQRIIDKHALPDGWLATILDSQGTVVARRPGGITHVGRSATADLRELLADYPEGLFRSVSLDGMPSVGYFSTSPQGWTYLTAMPRTELTQAVPPAVRNVALGTLGLLAAALVAAVWVSRRIVRPIVALKEAAARMQSGQSVAAQHATGIVECDEVSAAIATASNSMQQARADLERQVAAAVSRTRAAEQRASQSRRVEALGRLTGGVAHDFNNVLGIISNSVHMIQRHAGAPALAAPVSAALRAVEVGSRLTQYLQRFAGRQPVRPTAVDLAHYLLEAQRFRTATMRGNPRRQSLSMRTNPASANP
jgi:signal transduction histidine kinase